MMHNSENLSDDPLLAFLERGEKMPPRVSNAMLLLALRAERGARRREYDDLRAVVIATRDLLQGSPDGVASQTQPGGLLRRVESLERAARWVSAVLVPAGLAFLGAAGAWLFGVLVK